MVSADFLIQTTTIQLRVLPKPLGSVYQTHGLYEIINKIQRKAYYAKIFVSEHQWTPLTTW